MTPGTEDDAAARERVAVAEDAGPAAEPVVAARLRSWRHPAVLTAAALSAFAGYAQFGMTAALPDVAAAFGEGANGGTGIAAQVGLAGTTLGIGLAIIRLASLAALPLAGLGDVIGRRRAILGCVGVGLALTAVAAAAPSFWWLVALFALGRPALSATNGLAGVIVAEETRTADRAWAIALVTAGYGIGAGTSALLRGVFEEAIGFRELFGLAVVPLVLLVFLARALEEPARFVRVRGRRRSIWPRDLDPEVRRRLRVVAAITFAFSFTSGPINTYLFVYAESVVGLAPSVTAAVVLAAAPIGAAGLFAGRFAADRIGRIRTAAVAHVAVLVAGVVTYSGSATAAILGYLSILLCGSLYAPAGGAIGTELFPTEIRATVAGALTAAGVLGAVSGLLAFGRLADALGSFGAAAVAITAPPTLAVVLYLRLPETRHLELEDAARP